MFGLLLVLLYSCGLPDGDSGSQYLDYNLRGVWETTKLEDSLYARIEIEYKHITIIGNIAHLEDFTPGVPLEAYTKDSLIYINDRGEWQMQNPVSYRIWETGPSYPKFKMLTLKANGLKDETFMFLMEESGY